MSINNFYKQKCEDAIKKIEPRLKFLYKAINYLPCKQDAEKLQDKSEWYGHFLIKVEILGKEKDLVLAIPNGFPYEFPSIYLTRKAFEEDQSYENLPHIDDKLFVCTYDPDEAQPNEDYPVEVTFKTIQKALNIIEDGLLKRNIKDYNEEFLAYWNLKSKKRIISLIEPQDKPKDVYIIDLKELNKNYKRTFNYSNNQFVVKLNSLLANYAYVVADSFNDATKWLSNYGVIVSKNVEQNVRNYGLFLPLNSMGIPPFPEKNNDVAVRLSQKSSHSLDHLYNFLKTPKRPATIIFGIKNENKWMLGAWQHHKFTETVQKGIKKIPVNHYKGFRPGRHPVALELKGAGGCLPITKYNVERFDKIRLYNRTGEELSIKQDYKINMVGCGSIGSYLASDLVKVGFNNFIFVDNELLGSENLARHYCGVEHLAESKTNALKVALSKQYPHLNISTEEKDVRNLISNNMEFLNKADLNILAIANYSTETMINEGYKQDLINVPTLIVWVEPYIKAGQAILLYPNSKGCFKCLFDISNGHNTFKYSINKSNVTLREAGCQSTYLPYGALDICNFTNFLARIIKKIHNNEFTENMLFQFVKADDNLNYSTYLKTFEELEKFEYCCEGIS